MMPAIHFTDGTFGEVGYSKASEINEILEGRQEPKDDAQAEFCSRVARIAFEKPKQRFMNRRNIEHDPELHALMESNDLHGRDKFRAIGQHIRSRLII